MIFISQSAKKLTYNGKNRNPSITIKSGSKELVRNKDYTLTYSKERTNVGKYKIKVTMKGKYKGTATLYYNIIPKGTEINKITKDGTKIKGQREKKTKKMGKERITGYQIQISNDANFTENVKRYKVEGYQNTSREIKKLESGKTYNVRLRTYKIIDGNKYYSSWSKVKSVTIK